MSEMVPMTKEAYNRLRAEIEHLKRLKMPKIAERKSQKLAPKVTEGKTRVSRTT